MKKLNLNRRTFLRRAGAMLAHIPIIVAGGGAGTLNPGRSVEMPEGTTVKMLNLTLMQKMGLSIDSFHGETTTTDQL